MSGFDCSRQHELVTRLRGESIGRDVQRHLDGCAECAEIAQVITRLAPLRDAPSGAPHFSTLIWRAQAREILGASERRRQQVARPLLLFQGAVGLAMIVAAFLLAAGGLIGPYSANLAMGGPLIALVAAAVGSAALLSGMSSVSLRRGSNREYVESRGPAPAKAPPR